MNTLRMTASVVAAVAAITASSGAAATEPLNIKPGLWEMTTTMKMSGAPLYVESMTPSARAEYAKTWAEQTAKPSTDTDKDCITAKDIKEAKLIQDQSTAGKQCKQTPLKQTAAEWSASSECKDAKTTTEIQFDYTTSSPEHFKGTMKSTMTSPNGKTVFEATTTGKWVAASCPKEDSDDND